MVAAFCYAGDDQLVSGQPEKPDHADIGPTVIVPTLIIWGRKDQFLGAGLAERSLDFCEKGQGILLGEATHWVHHEESERVNNLILNFIEQ